MITSRQHHVVKKFRAVARGDPELALIDGWHLLRDAIAAGVEIETVAREDRRAEGGDLALLEQLAHQTKVLGVSTAVMKALSPVQTPSGVVALVRKRRYELTSMLAPPPPLLVAVFDVQDPGNTGAVIRSAEAGGATGIIFSGVSADPWGWKALRAAMGSTFRLPLVEQRQPSAACATLRAHGLQLCAAVPRLGVAMHDVNFRAATAVLLGGEGQGLDDSVIASADLCVSIPMSEGVDSLNIAVAAALLVYEARRQRQVA